jgi:hypothetical protein
MERGRTMTEVVQERRLFTNTAETAATGSSPVIQATGSEVILAVQVSDVTGTSPTLDFELKYSVDGDTWFSATGGAHAFTQITAAGFQFQAFSLQGKYARVEWAIGGTDTPTFTFLMDVLVH